MSEVHETLAREWLAMCERKERPPLTVWETEQLLRGWLDREQLRGMLKWQVDLRENAVNEIERLRARLAEAQQLLATRVEAERLSEANARLAEADVLIRHMRDCLDPRRTPGSLYGRADDYLAKHAQPTGDKRRLSRKGNTVSASVAQGEAK